MNSKFCDVGGEFVVGVSVLFWFSVKLKPTGIELSMADGLKFPSTVSKVEYSKCSALDGFIPWLEISGTTLAVVSADDGRSNGWPKIKNGPLTIDGFDEVFSTVTIFV